MTSRVWSLRRSKAASAPVLRAIAARVDLRFGVTAGTLAARVEELAAEAGAPAAELVTRLSLDDLYLATACAADDPGAWGECEEKHFAFIRMFARRFLSDADARDLADQVIADLWQRKKIGRYGGRSTLRTWLGSVVAHAAVNARRTACPRPPQTSIARAAGAPEAVAPEAATAERQLADLVTRAIEALTAEEKLLLRLYYDQGLTLDQMEIATRLSKATLSRRLTALRERLRRAIDERAAREFATSGARAVEGLALNRIEFDLSALLRPVEPLEEERRGRV